LPQTKKVPSNISKLYGQKVKEAAKVDISRKSGIDEQHNNCVSYKLYYVRYADAYLVAVKGPK
jgi:hypothetical protein